MRICRPNVVFTNKLVLTHLNWFGVHLSIYPHAALLVPCTSQDAKQACETSSQGDFFLNSINCTHITSLPQVALTFEMEPIYDP